MRLNLVGGVVAVLIIVALVVAYGTLFTVYQTRQALVVRLGQPVRVVVDPGLNYKIPLIDSVINIDKRILDLENPAQEVIASDQKRLVVDAFARYRIKDVLKFFQTVGTVEGANSQLSILLNSALRRVLGEATLTQVVRDQREHLMARVREQLDNEAQAFDNEHQADRGDELGHLCLTGAVVAKAAATSQALRSPPKDYLRAACPMDPRRNGRTPNRV